MSDLEMTDIQSLITTSVQTTTISISFPKLFRLGLITLTCFNTIVLIIVVYILLVLSASVEDFKCSNNGSLLKRLTLSSHCEEGWMFSEHTQFCYSVYFHATKDQAEEICQSHSSHLVSIHSAEENKFVHDLSSTHSLNLYENMIWIGLTRGRNNTWSYTDGTQMDFDAFAPGEPNGNPGEDCVQLFSDKLQHKKFHEGKWNDYRCDQVLRAFVCKKPSSVLPPKTFIKTASCEVGWNLLKTTLSCYKRFDDDTSSFAGAEKSCSREKAHVTSIHSSEENDFLFNMLKGHTFATWIGLTRTTQELHGFQWTDGSAFNYSNWTPKEPNSKGEENCTEMYIETQEPTWNDCICKRNDSQISVYVCKKSALNK